MRLPVTTRCPLDIIQATGETPAYKCRHKHRFYTSLTTLSSLSVHGRLMLQQRRRFPDSPDPLLLLGLHHSCTSQHAVDDLLLLIREVLPRGAARYVHRPLGSGNKTHTHAKVEMQMRQKARISQKVHQWGTNSWVTLHPSKTSELRGSDRKHMEMITRTILGRRGVTCCWFVCRANQTLR